MWKKRTLYQRKKNERNSKEEYKRWSLKELTEMATKEMGDLSIIECHYLFYMSIPGISFIDMAHLKKSAIDNNKLYYYHLKTGKRIEVTLTKKMWDIINFLIPLTGNSPYLFPILLEAVQHPTNECLKKSRQLSAPTACHNTWKTLTEREQIPPPDSDSLDGLKEI